MQDALLKKDNQPRYEVLDLINWIEKNQSEIIKWHDGLTGVSWLVLFFFVAIAWTTSSIIHDYAVSIAITIAGFSGLIAYFSFIVQTSEGRILEKRFGRAKKVKSDFNDRDQVLLKSLIKIKGANEEINLKTLYEMDKEANGETFSEKNLIGILCK